MKNQFLFRLFVCLFFLRKTIAHKTVDNVSEANSTGVSSPYSFKNERVYQVILIIVIIIITIIIMIMIIIIILITLM